MNQSVELAKECMRQAENCLYTSTTFFHWLRYARWIRTVFVTTPIICGAIATWSLLTAQPVVTGIFSLFAGLLPLLEASLKWDTRVDGLARTAAEFKNLQDRFRQAALVLALGPYDAFKSDFDRLMERLEKAREESVTPPEFCFKAAQEKISAGHYKFEVDEAAITAAASPS